MRKNDMLLAKSVAVFLVLVCVGAVIAVSLTRKTAPPVKATEVALPTPTQIRETRQIHAPNGDKVLSMKRIGTAYSFFIDGKEIFAKTTEGIMSIPFNAFDPSESYIFLAETSAGAPNYYVMKTDGTGLIDVGAVWKAKQMPYAIREVTGWASETLLIIYTNGGPHYWFEIPDTAIIQLWR